MEITACQHQLKQPHCIALIQQSDSHLSAQVPVCQLTPNVNSFDIVRRTAASEQLTSEGRGAELNPWSQSFVQIYFADFPYQLCSVVQRLLTFEDLIWLRVRSGTKKKSFGLSTAVGSASDTSNDRKKFALKKRQLFLCGIVCVSLSFAVDVFADRSNPLQKTTTQCYEKLKSHLQ